MLSASWCLIIRSYRQLNREKFRTLRDLEKQLPYQFFTLEWDPESKGEKSNSYQQLTHVEVTLPSILCTLYLALIGYAIWTKV